MQLVYVRCIYFHLNFKLQTYEVIFTLSLVRMNADILALIQLGLATLYDIFSTARKSSVRYRLRLHSRHP